MTAAYPVDRRLVLIRHGQTEYNATGRMQGQLDTELSEVGREQARAAAEVLAGWAVSRVIASDLERAEETARILAEPWGVDVETDQRLRETDLGAWQGASHKEVDADYPGQRAYWKHDPEWAPPQGESRVQVAERAFAVVDEVMNTDAFDRGLVVIVAHGGTIGALTARLLNLPSSHSLVFSGLGNVCWSQLLARPQFVGAGDSSVPAVDGSTVPLVPSGAKDWWKTPKWLLEGWNVHANAAAPAGAPSPDEGGEATSGEGNSAVGTDKTGEQLR
ncbi:histidine phosphatase family protein [Corynebacterium auriscanis]|uniref:histidine phosphatase family protein n=1 Tax=Corynebacterium auriscanis TaxID=99807 RepID=UPI00224652FB|nr:histidine phosphatase family protein [Corynebacterium auriscanis]MCX2163363.1 histidine phosphatase family protein [Corynebacterium auriscanis]